MTTNETSSQNSVPLRNATLAAFGGMGVILLADWIFFLFPGNRYPSLIPGFPSLVQLCYPILYFWAGLLLRSRVKSMKGWIQALVICVSLFFLYRYLQGVKDGLWTYRFIGNLYFAAFGVGFLVPAERLTTCGRDAGWFPLLMLSLSVFCYVAIDIVRQRLSLGEMYGEMIPEHPGMVRLMASVLRFAEPAMVMLVLYFAAQFAFSQIAQSLGARSWFRWMAAIACIPSFVLLLLRTCSFFYPLLYMHNGMYYSPLLNLLVHPAAVGLLIVLWRVVKKIQIKIR